MTYRYFVNGVERKVEDMTEEEKRNRAVSVIKSIGGQPFFGKVSEEHFEKKQVTA